MATTGQWSGQWGGDWLGDVAGPGGNPVVFAALRVSGVGTSQMDASILMAAPSPENAPGGGAPLRRPLLWFPHHQIPNRRPKKRRQADIIFMRP